MKKKLPFFMAVIVIATLVAIPVIVATTTKTIGSVSYADAKRYASSDSLSGKTEAEVIQALGQPDFRIVIDNEVRMQYEIERDTHVLKLDFLPSLLCIIIDQQDDQVIDTYISD